VKRKEVSFLILVVLLAIGGILVKGFIYNWDWRCIISGECRINK